MKVRIKRVNDATLLEAIDAKGKVKLGLGPKTKKALNDAEKWYRGEVKTAFEKRGVGDLGYASDFERAYAKSPPEGVQDRQIAANKRLKARGFAAKPVEQLEAVLTLALKPEGFAWEDEHGVPQMNNTGSTPTTMRARVLLCYQDPLEKVLVERETDDEDEDDGVKTKMYKYEIVKEF